MLVAMSQPHSNSVVRVGDSLEDLWDFPPAVQREIGFALRQAQDGGKHPDARPLKGFGGASVLEIIEDHDGHTYRAVYTVRFADAVYVLHVFQKKSKKQIATVLVQPKPDFSRRLLSDTLPLEPASDRSRKGGRDDGWQGTAVHA
jgi:phage-related protein